MSLRDRTSTAFVALALALTALGAAATASDAKEREVSVRLPDGQLQTLVVDIPRGTSVFALDLPGVPVAVDGEAVTEPEPESDAEDGAEPRDERAGRKPRGRRSTGRPRRRNDGRRGAARKPRPAPHARVDRPAGATSLPGPASSGGSAFAIEDFRTPVFLLPIYRAAAARYGVPWQLLAAINEIESDYGRNPGVSVAGAKGWMQFMPATWRTYGVDANGDRRRDPYNAVDAIYAAARYLEAAGARQDLARAIFAYNHADWYVADVLTRMRRIEAAPERLVGPLSQLVAGRPPIVGRARYRDVPLGAGRDAHISAPAGATVAAVDDGVVRSSKRRGRHRRVVLQDGFGNRYEYAWLADRATARRRGVRRTKPLAVPRPVARALRFVLEWLGVDLRKVTRPHRAGVPRRGTRVGRGKSLGELGGGKRSTLRFTIRPAGTRSRATDPRPVLEAWSLLERAGATTLGGDSDLAALLRLPPRRLEHRVLADSRITLYGCGRRDIAEHRIDRRVLIALIYLADAGLDPTVSSLECGHGRLTASGNVSEHSVGSAVDISHLAGVPVLGNQRRGGPTERAVRRLLELDGQMAPHQVISLLDLGGASFAMSDHADHIHLGFSPGAEGKRSPLTGPTPDEWDALLAQATTPTRPQGRPGT